MSVVVMSGASKMSSTLTAVLIIVMCASSKGISTGDDVSCVKNIPLLPSPPDMERPVINSSNSLPSDRAQVIVPAYTFKCTGNVTSWGACLGTRPNENGTQVHYIEMQVWRENSTESSCYSLVGFNSLNISTLNQSCFHEDVPRNEQIPVLPGDVVGYFTEQSVLHLDTNTSGGLLLLTSVDAGRLDTVVCGTTNDSNGRLSEVRSGAPIITAKVAPSLPTNLTATENTTIDSTSTRSAVPSPSSIPSSSPVPTQVNASPSRTSQPSPTSNNNRVPLAISISIASLGSLALLSLLTPAVVGWACSLTRGPRPVETERVQYEGKDSPPIVLHGSMDDVLEMNGDEEFVTTCNPEGVTSLTFLNRVDQYQQEDDIINATTMGIASRCYSDSQLLRITETEPMGASLNEERASNTDISEPEYDLPYEKEEGRIDEGREDYGSAAAKENYIMNNSESYQHTTFCS